MFYKCILDGTLANCIMHGKHSAVFIFRFHNNNWVYWSTEVTGDTFGSDTLYIIYILYGLCDSGYWYNLSSYTPWTYLQPVSYLILTYCISWAASHSVWHLVLITYIMNLACKICGMSTIQKSMKERIFYIIGLFDKACHSRNYEMHHLL
jgi:hypothetical protein